MEYRTIRPLEVFAIDENMNRASGTIPYSSLTWRRRYNKPGQFEMSFPADMYDTSWRFIFAYARPETGIIQKVEFSDTAQTPDGRDTVTVSGFFMEEMLNWLTFLVEQPEEKTIEIHIPAPKTPGIMRKDMPKIYRDKTTGNYYYQNSSGDLVNEAGEKVDGDSDWETVSTTFVGMTEVDGTWGALPNDMMSSNFNYRTEDGKITVTSWFGSSKTYDIAFEDDKGNIYYKTPGYDGQDGNPIAIANACATLNANKSYYSAKRAWNASGGVRYETITVKGPWQRTDTMEPITESDSVDQLFKWLQTFFGATFKYQEPDFEGVVKTLDPSLQRMGDFAYSVLQEVGASLRVVYGFENDALVLEAYKGKDRTQAGNAPKVATLAAAPRETYPVPEGYTALEYIESTGTQYIDTGFNPDQDTRVVFDFEFTSQPSRNWAVFGARTNYDIDSCCFWWVSAYFRSDYKADATREWAVPSTDRYTVDFNKNVTIFAGETKSATYASFSTPQTLYLFAMNNNYTTANMSSMRAYSCDIYSDGSIERSFIPAKRDSDGAVGMYDTVGGQFYGNSGTGAFVSGPDVPRPVDPDPPGPDPEPVGGNPWTVFSDTWGTIKGYSASRDDSNYRNTCYELYSYDQPPSFESDGTPHLEEIPEVQDDGTVKVLGWEIPYETKRGYQTARVEDDVEGDRECYLDLRESGGAPSCDSQWSRDRYDYDESQPNDGKPTFEPMQELYEQWPDALTAKGVAELQQNYGVVTNLSTGTVVTSGYMVDWDLGDLVDFGVSTVGLLSEARIIAVDEVYDRNGAEINIEVGDELLTETKRMKLN